MKFEYIIFFLYFIILGLYAYVLITFRKRKIEKKRFHYFYNAIVRINNKKLPLYESYNQLQIVYDKLCENFGNTKSTSILDLLKSILYFCDTYEDERFKSIFQKEKDEETTDFICNVINYINRVDPFISVPPKSKNLLDSISDELNRLESNISGTTLEQLALEISITENELLNEKEQTKKTYFLTILGIVLTVIFGMVSIIFSMLK